MIIAASVVIVAAFAITAFLAPGFLIRKSNSKYDEVNISEENLAAMLDYAKELEANGNAAAAAQIYSMIPDSAMDAAKGEANRVIDSTSEKKMIDSIGEARDILNDIDDIEEVFE